MVEGDNVQKKKKESVSPKVTRPKLPKFGSHTLGHHPRHKTDPGQPEQIRSLMEEIKKWKDGSIFDKSLIRPKVIKPRTIPKAHSTQTSPKGSPPPGSPNAVGRSSSLNRNRSKSLKLLTDKLKSGRGGQTSPKQTTKTKKSDENSSKLQVPGVDPDLSQFVDNENDSKGRSQFTEDYDTHEKVDFTEAIPEKDEKDLDDDKDDTSSGDTVGTPERGLHRTEIQFKLKDSAGSSPRLSEDEGIGENESDSPLGASFTPHPIDRNSEFLRLRQMAPKRRPAYAGLQLPKSKLPSLHKSDDKNEDGTIQKPNKLELGSLGNTRKTSGARFSTHPPQSRSTFHEDGSFDTNGFGSFRSPSFEASPPFPGELREVHSDGSLADSQFGTDEGSEIGVSFPDVIQTIFGEERSSAEAEKLEKRNIKSPKQKSKSDPSGNKTFDFDVPGVISSSQSKSFPILGKNETFKSKSLDDDPKEIQVDQERRKSENTIDTESENLSVSVSASDQSKSYGTSLSEDMIFSPQSDYSDAFEDPMSQSMESEEFQNKMDIIEPIQEGADDHEGSMEDSIVSYDSSAPITPVTHSPSGTIERTQNLLSVPTPKRPISRSVSSASVLTRERKFSGGNLKDKSDSVIRKHSITGGDEGTISEKPMDFLPIGESGNSLAASMPSVWRAERLASESPDRDAPFKKDKRYHIVEELFKNEKEYVEALKTLKERYMAPLKTLSSIDETVIDNIFYMIPEILMHHVIYHEFLNDVWKKWNTDTSTVGDIILKTFSGQSVQDSYLSFVENYKTSGKVIENALQTKSSVQKFVEQCQKDSGSKLTLKDLIVRPIQRIPRYELLIQRLLDNTPGNHPDYILLKQAERVMHEFARKIGSANETQIEDSQQETLKKLELLLINDLAVPDRSYLRHDMVQIMNKKDTCCLWMLSDLILISSIKRKSGPVTRKVSVILKSPTGQDFAENVKHKVWLKVGLDDIEIVKSQGSLKRTSSLNKEQVEEDLDILEMVQDLTNKLNCMHNSMEEVLKEMTSSLQKQLSEYNTRYSLMDSTKMELLVTTQEGVLHLDVNFTSGEKRSSWETTFLDAKLKLSQLSDKRAPEFLQPLQITKTRAGMQFSCAAPIDGLNAGGHRDVWVCNSDGYVGHMCLLSLQPEPIVTLNTPVPGCNARILCIAAVPSHTFFRRKSSGKRRHKSPSPAPVPDAPCISIEEVDKEVTEEEPAQLEITDTISEEGYQSDSDSSTDEFDDEYTSTRKLYVEDYVVKRPQPSQFTQSSPDPIATTGSWAQDPHKSTMWLGTEDGCIHIFQCTDNIKTTKNKLKIQLGYPVYCIIYLDNKVFVSLSNGDLIVYRRDSDGMWDTENPYTRAIGSVTAPIVRMLPVAGKLWCGCQNNICIINPLSLSVETTFQVHQDSNKGIQCIVNSGLGVWIASQQSSKVHLYHATTYESLLEVSIAQAVNQKLQSADDIIRQHKAACLRITALLVCKDLLWIGTSAGVILTVPMPRITSTTSKGSHNVPSVTGLVYGHTGHVRFLTCVELTSGGSGPPLLGGSTTSSPKDDQIDPPSPRDLHRRSSVATVTAPLATRMLVISGGDGYEDFKNNVANESAGRDDSTNHLLLWQV